CSRRHPHTPCRWNHGRRLRKYGNRRGPEHIDGTGEGGMSLGKTNWSRRDLLAAVPGIVAGVAAMAQAQTGSGTQTVPWSAGTELPRLKLPPNAADCHHHIYDACFPRAPQSVLKP